MLISRQFTTRRIIIALIVFWLSYVLGTLSVLYSWLVAIVPPPPNGVNYTLAFIVRSGIVSTMFITIFIGRWILRSRNSLSNQGPAHAIRVVLFVAWAELAYALLGIIGFAATLILRGPQPYR